jgi:ribose/xylose/arabinose/galactoside ABC-type transport system permease subunit
MTPEIQLFFSLLIFLVVTGTIIGVVAGVIAGFMRVGFKLAPFVVVLGLVLLLLQYLQ